MENRFTSDRIIGGKRRRIIVDINGNIIDRNPSKEELIGLKEGYHKIKRRLGYTEKSICHRCIEDNDVTKDSILCPGNAYLEKDKNGNDTGKYVCRRHWKRYYDKHCPDSSYRAIKSVTNCRTGNQNPNSKREKGDRTQQLACILYRWEDLNEKNNNYNFPIDCYDPKTELFHQVRGRRYDPIYKLWNSGNLEREWIKKYEDMAFFCKSNDEKRIEEIYRIPHREIEGRKNISITRFPTDSVGDPIIPWYEKYRVKDVEELKKANEIWQKILEKENFIEKSKKVKK